MENESFDVATNSAAEIVPGTLLMLILKTLANGPMHGAAVAEAIHLASSGMLRVQEGALYPALHRLELRKWVAAEKGLSEHKRRAIFYRLTSDGVKALSDEHSRWERMTEAIARIMEAQN
ncbi:MAG TPA: PadR family transcriptional regulator [Candidatus Acidoferrales bacterium]|nr:PadR family transcriptional regulator [Candidatus Acidoferrales bacterium]